MHMHPPAGAATKHAPPAVSVVVDSDGGAVTAVAPATPPGAGAAAAAQTWPVRRRVAWAKGLLLLGCAAAMLAVFAMAPTPADSDSPRVLGQGGGASAACARTDAEAAALRAASTKLLLSASAQVLAATVVLHVTAPPIAFFGWLLSVLNAYLATDVVEALVSCCLGHVHAGFAVHYLVLFAMMCVANLVRLPVF